MTTLCLRGPDIAIVGWIPYFDALADLPTGHNYQASLAMHLLFNSGNDEPRRTETKLYPQITPITQIRTTAETASCPSLAKPIWTLELGVSRLVCHKASI